MGEDGIVVGVEGCRIYDGDVVFEVEFFVEGVYEVLGECVDVFFVFIVFLDFD